MGNAGEIIGDPCMSVEAWPSYYTAKTPSIATYKVRQRTSGRSRQGEGAVSLHALTDFSWFHGVLTRQIGKRSHIHVGSLARRIAGVKFVFEETSLRTFNQSNAGSVVPFLEENGYTHGRKRRDSISTYIYAG